MKCVILGCRGDVPGDHVSRLCRPHWDAWTKSGEFRRGMAIQSGAVGQMGPREWASVLDFIRRIEAEARNTGPLPSTPHPESQNATTGQPGLLPGISGGRP